ncbi:MAG TPA: VCBS domain-containing protein [Patescibacteria group bacterium]|nr:VCBS domain-containing protein [Patescibacteria group bacterium]
MFTIQEEGTYPFTVIKAGPTKEELVAAWAAMKPVTFEVEDRETGTILLPHKVSIEIIGHEDGSGDSFFFDGRCGKEKVNGYYKASRTGGFLRDGWQILGKPPA